MCRWLKSVLAAAGMLLGLAAASAASAQQPVPPARYTTDERGVDLTSGGYFPFVTEVMIGQPGAGGLVYGRSHIGTGWRDSLLGTVNSNGTTAGSTVQVSIGPYTEAFTVVGSTFSSFTPVTPNGSTLVWNNTTSRFVYTSSTGVVATFLPVPGWTTPYENNQGLVETITSPDGEVLTYTYRQQYLCTRNAQGQCIVGTYVPVMRLEAVTNTLGYQIKYLYFYDGDAAAQISGWLAVEQVVGVNRGVDYCADNATSCSFTTIWPSVTYSGTTVDTHTATDEMGRVTTYGMDSDHRLVSVRLPGSSTDNVTVVYDTSDRVTDLTDATGAWDYSYATAGSVLTVTATGPDSQAYEVISEEGLIQSYEDVDGEVTVFAWTTDNLLDTITYPEGNGVDYTHDARGNVTQTTVTPKPGSGLSNIVTSATYPASCTDTGISRVNCDLPLTTTDSRGNVTTYDWSDVHGGLESVTSPPQYSGWTAPQTRIAYSQVHAWYRNSSGSIVQATTPVWRPTETSACQWGTASACDGTFYERLTSVTYQAGSSSAYSNVLPATLTTGSGDAAIVVTTTSTFNAYGDVSSVDGPLSGSGDRTVYFYNANRELTGAIGPDPDGGGALRHRALRITRNSLGLPTLTEQGTTTGYSGFSSFVLWQQVAATYDVQGRPLTQALSDGTTTYSLSQISYDVGGRPDCTAVRMNPSQYDSLPTSACTATTSGSYGPDRITFTGYNALGQVESVVTGYGVTGAITESLTYTDNGQVETMTDGEGNLTAWAYDGFDRPWRMYYPNATGGGSSTTDYEQLTYDAHGLLYSSRTRDNQLFYFSFNALGQPDYVSAPSPQLDVQTYYDQLGSPFQINTVGTGGQTIDRTHDVLGRLLVEDGPLGAVTWWWDSGSRVVRITWPDAYYAEYLHDLTGAMTQVRENGATSGAGVLATYAYDDLGQRTSVTRGNGAVTTYSWDGGSRLIGLALNLSGTSQDATWTMDYNPAGQVVERTLSNTAYAYTAAASLSDIYATNGLNQTTAVDSASVGYDARENIDADPTGFGWQFDASNRITRGDTTGVTIADYLYDPAGRLWSIDAGTAYDRRFLYAGGQAIAEYDGAGALVQRFVPGAGLDDYAAYTVGTSGITRTWPAADPLGSVTALVNASNVATQINTYDEYGVPASGNVGRFGYAGAMFLNFAGPAPWNMRNRQYHPTLGRFLQTDPIGLAGGVNLYAYVGNDPVNLVDPFGLQEEPPDEVDPVEIFGVPICSRRGVVCNVDDIAIILRWIESQSANDERIHDAYTWSFICVEGQGNCTPERVRACLERYPAPGASGNRRVRSGDRTTLDGLNWQGIGIEGSVAHVITDSAVINVTLPGHDLHPGVAIRSVASRELFGRFSLLGVSTRSLGTGGHATVNEGGTPITWFAQSRAIASCVAAGR